MYVVDEEIAVRIALASVFDGLDLDGTVAYTTCRHLLRSINIPLETYK